MIGYNTAKLIAGRHNRQWENRMRKSLLICIVLILSAALLLSACGSQDAPPATEALVADPPATEEQVADPLVTEGPGEIAVENTPETQPEALAYPSPVTQQAVSPYPQPGGGELPAGGITLDSLLATLQSAGLDTQVVGDVSQPFFSAAGKSLQLNGEELQVYEYPTPEAAEAEAALVSTDGTSVGTTLVNWISTPHFFRAGNLIVIYIGENPAVLQGLQSLLGTQFAGG